MKKVSFILIVWACLLTSKYCEAGFHFGTANAGAKKFANIADRADNPSRPPANLTMPVPIVKISSSPIDPFGVIRWSLDTGGGHPGIDLSISSGDPIYAVADGVIVNLSAPQEQNPGGGGILPGYKITLYIGSDPDAKSGWVFFYESVELEPGIGLNSRVKRGQVIGRNAGMGHHLELAYAFDGFSTRESRVCWADQLEASEKAAFFDRFNSIRASNAFINYWQNNQRNGQFPFQGLLDTGRYPAGAQLCYPLGTDVR